MKKLVSLFACIAMVGLFVGVTSCDKEDPIPAGPEVAVTAPGYTINSGSFEVGVTKDSTIIFSYSVNAAGKIKQLTQSVNGVQEIISAAVGQTSYNKQVVINVPYEDGTHTLEVSAVDEHDQPVSGSVSLVVKAIIPPSIPLTENQLITMGGSTSPSEFSRWDLDRPKGYGYWALKGGDSDQAVTMDSYYTTLSLSDTDNLGTFEESGAKFLITEFTKEDYDNMDTDLLLQDLDISETYLQFIEVGQVIAFRTNLDKLGVMYLKEYYESSDDIDIEIKLQDK